MRKLLMIAACLLSAALMLLPLIGQQSSPPSSNKKQNAKKGPPIYRASDEEKQQIQAGLKKLDAAINQIKAKRGEDDLMADVEVYSKAGHWLLDYPDDIAVSDAKVSSFHARIDRIADGFQLVDLKSRNGCWLNGKRVETAVLKTGDEIRVGAARILYKIDYTSSV